MDGWELVHFNNLTRNLTRVGGPCGLLVLFPWFQPLAEFVAWTLSVFDFPYCSFLILSRAFLPPCFK